MLRSVVFFFKNMVTRNQPPFKFFQQNEVFLKERGIFLQKPKKQVLRLMDSEPATLEVDRNFM